MARCPLSFKCLCVFGLLGALHMCVLHFFASFSLPFSELSLVGLALNMVD